MRTNPASSQADARQRLAMLRALARPAVRAEWSSDGAHLVLAVSLPCGATSVLRAKAKQVAALASLGLVGQSQGHPAITPAGRAWLRRQLASDDPFLAQHRDTHLRTLRGPGGTNERVQINDAESPLAWLRQRKDRKGAALLDEQQFTAGERLRRDFTFAALSPRVTANWSSPSAGDAHSRKGPSLGNMRDDVLAAKERVNRALMAVGPELGRMLMDVCCLLKGIESAESTQGLPRRSGKVVLQLGLSALARHYGLARPSHPHHHETGRLLHWGSSDYRPVI